jgi:tetratricopeptide (TPR) repeat protein
MVPFALVLCVGAAIRLAHIHTIMFFGDEPLNQVRICFQPLSFVWHHQTGSLLFSVLNHVLLPLGDLELMSRLPSVFAGVLTIVAVYLLGCELFSRQSGLFAAGFTALSPLLIFYSQHGRAYAVFLLLWILMTLSFFRGFHSGQTKPWAAFFVLAAAATLTHSAAFLSLAALMIYLAAEWIKGRFHLSHQLGKALVWTGSAAGVAFLLNITVPHFRSYILGRARLGDPDVTVTFSAIDDLLRTQLVWGAQSGIFYIVILVLAAVGAAAGLKKSFQGTLLLLCHAIVPYAIFFLMRPSENYALSAYRYLIFLLPIVYLLAAQGIGSAAFVLSFRKSSRTDIKPHSLAVRKKFALLGALVIAVGIGSFFRDYYIEYWRLGVFKPDKDVRKFLKLHVKRDALIYFDVFPASHLISIINPLDKRLKPEEMTMPIRTKFQIGDGEHEYLLYRVFKLDYDHHVAVHHADVWAVFPVQGVHPDQLLKKAEGADGCDVFRLERWTVLHLNAPDMNVRAKMARLTEWLVDLPVEPCRKRHYHLLAAKAFLSVYDAEDVYQQLDKFRDARVESDEEECDGRHLVNRFLDAVFGLQTQDYRAAGEAKILADIQSLIFRFGNHYGDTGEMEKALDAYARCFQMGDAFTDRIVNRILGFASRAAADGYFEKSVRLRESALHFDPQRKDIRLLLAEAYRRDGRKQEAEDMYRAALYDTEIPEGFFEAIEDERNAVVVWETRKGRHVLFLGRGEATDPDTHYRVRFESQQRIRDVQSLAFTRDDILSYAGKRGILEAKVMPGHAKALSLSIPAKSRMTWDVRVYGRRGQSSIFHFKNR